MYYLSTGTSLGCSIGPRSGFHPRGRGFLSTSDHLLDHLASAGASALKIPLITAPQLRKLAENLQLEETYVSETLYTRLQVWKGLVCWVVVAVGCLQDK